MQLKITVAVSLQAPRLDWGTCSSTCLRPLELVFSLLPSAGYPGEMNEAADLFNTGLNAFGNPVAENFPEECRFVLETLHGVYRNDGLAREPELSPEDGYASINSTVGP